MLLDYPYDVSMSEIAAQIELEKKGSALGTQRLEKSINSSVDSGATDETRSGQAIINSLLKRATEFTSKNLAADFDRRKGRPAKITEFRELVEFLDTQVLTAIALRQCVNGAMSEDTWNSVTYRIGNEIVNEACLVSVKREDKREFAKLQNYLKQELEPQRKAKILQDILARKGISGEFHYELTRTQMTFLGAYFAMCILEGLHDNEGYLIETHKKFKNNKSTIHLNLSERALGWFNKTNSNLLSLANMPLPMVVPPVPLKEGAVDSYGYLTTEAPKVSLIKTSNRQHINSLNTAHFPALIKGINAAMHTAWSINKDILALAEVFKDSDDELGGLPRATLEQHKTERPAYADPMLDPEAFRLWKMKKTAAAKRDKDLVSKRATFLLKLQLARLMSGHERFFNVWQLDKRGRGYPLSMINCQGDDFTKSLLKNAEPTPLGDRGFFWMRLHLANLLADDPRTGDNIDKLALDERVKWVDDNKAFLQDLADDYKNPTHWRKDTGYIALADKPWQFLTVLLEYNIASRMGDTSRFLSHLNCALDGSCSGLQVLGASFRCEKTAQLVNLIDNDKPDDIYSRVAENVAQQVDDWLAQRGIDTFEKAREYRFQAVKEACESNDLNYHLMLQELAASQDNLKEIPADVRNAWRESTAYWGWKLHGVKRKTVKRSVMTFCYSSKEFGFKEQLMEDTLLPLATEVSEKLRTQGHGLFHSWSIEDRIKNNVGFPFEVNGSFAAQVLAKILYATVKDMVAKPAEAMNWLVEMANLITKDGRLVQWVNPVGLPVIQDYRKTSDKTIDCHFLGKRHQIQVKEKTTTPDTAKAKSAVAPNVVHSIDSALMWSIVAKAVDKGHKQFALVHDSFGVPFGETESFFNIIREAFLELFSDDYFSHLKEQFMSQMNEETLSKSPELPSHGEYDLASILNSKHAFA